MKIWIIGRNYPLPQNGMQGSFELEQAKMLANHGHKVCYLACCLHPIKRIKGKEIQVWVDDNVEVRILSAMFPPRIYPFYFNKQRNRIWKKLLDEAERKNGLPDVIHVHYPAMLMISDVLAEYNRKKVRIVATEHWSKVLGKKLDKLELNEYSKYKDTVNKFICVGSPLAASVKELVNVEPEIVPNIVNPLFKPSTEKHEGFRFVAVGRLVPVKQFDKIIEAFSECFRNNMDVSLLIIGGGQEKNKLQRIINENKIGDRVTLLGSQDREHTAELVANCDSLICYSRFETFGVPVIEAWACGLTTTTTTAVAVVDNFDSRLGVEVSYDDTDQLMEKMKYIYEKSSSFDKSFISKYAQDHFSESVIYQQLMGIYMKP